MSRNFEVLQRLERERSAPSGASVHTNTVARLQNWDRHLVYTPAAPPGIWSPGRWRNSLPGSTGCGSGGGKSLTPEV